MSVIWRITHGYDLVDLSDPLANVVESVNDEFSSLMAPGHLYLVEVLPFCEYHLSIKVSLSTFLSFTLPQCVNYLTGSLVLASRRLRNARRII